MKKVLVTGTAGFIGFHLASRLLELGYEVTGLDNINDYYDLYLKYDRLGVAGIPRESIKEGRMVRSNLHPAYSFIKLGLEDGDRMRELFRESSFDLVVNLAAQAGVRYSLTHPETYISSNITGFLNILEACRHTGVSSLIYASSSSVYGLNKSMPFSVNDRVDHPVSLYATSKKSNELMAHTYSHLFGLPTTGLRFFTVYGPWGRPDMALFIFTRAILSGEAISLFNYGRMERDFTYVDDIVNGICRMVEKPSAPDPAWDPVTPDPSSSSAPYRIYNIGNSTPVSLMDFVKAIENETGRKAILNMEPMQPGDVEKTWADVSTLASDFDYRPSTPLEQGVAKFIAWYRDYYRV
ncbi:MAG: NAD-dependent epimerase [Bacteroidota bacterium]